VTSSRDTALRRRLDAEAQRQLHGDTLPRALLLEGFTFEDTRVPLLAPQGIFTRQSSTCH
jgi:hypothetical protein